MQLIWKAGPRGPAAQASTAARRPDPTTRPRALRVAAVLLAALCLAAPAVAAETRQQELDNGLRVIVQVDRRAPVVTSQIWYRIGSSYEPPGLTGISHVLEHMMFKGTRTLGPGELSRLVAENGGRQNAFTGPDYTAYFQTLSRDRLALSLRIEADRMRNLALEEAAFQREREVVIEERRLRVADNPAALARERSRAAAFTVNPYRQPIIGWRADLERLRLQDLERWYDEWYQPGNATLVVAGDVEPAEVFALAEQWFGGIPAGPVAAAPRLDEPERRGRLRYDIDIPGDVTYVYLDFPVPSLGALAATGAAEISRRELFALELLAGVLAGHDGARLRRVLERDAGLAARTSVDYDLYARLETLFTLSAVAVPGVAGDDIARAMLDAVRAMAAEPPALAEVEAARAQLLAARVYRNDSVFYRAMELGLLDAAGLPWEERDRYAGELGAVTPADISAVAKRFLDPGGAVVTVAAPDRQG